MRGNRVELHVHLDGAIRPTTLFETAQRRGKKLPDSVKCADDLIPYMTVKPSCTSLIEFLETFFFFTPIVEGDQIAIEQIAFEFVETQASLGVAYSEARYAPHLLVDEEEGFDASDVVAAVNQGIRRGEEKFGVKVRTLLCCMRHRPEWSMEVAQLAMRNRDMVVGIDLAGDEHTHWQDSYMHAPAFELAKSEGIHRTVHAGEAAGWKSMEIAMNVLHAERIGHGYRLVASPELYDKIREQHVHLECCLSSSRATNSVPADVQWKHHPVRKFARDGLNYSLSTDDPSVMGIDLNHEIHLAKELGFSKYDLRLCALNAAKSSFLPADEKSELIAHLMEVHTSSSTETVLHEEVPLMRRNARARNRRRSHLQHIPILTIDQSTSGYSSSEDDFEHHSNTWLHSLRRGD